jgi:hypothetical protein
MSRPTAPADCQGAEHGANHGSQQSTSAVDEQMVQFCNMLPRREASHTAVASGSWSSPSTWSGQLPGPDAKVLIPAGTTITVDREHDVPLSWIRVEGVLRFRPDISTALIVETLKVEPSGRLEIGTAASPISANATARVVIRARGGKPIDQSSDPLELGRGVIAHGMVEIHGAAKTPFVAVSTAPRAGAATIVVDQAPSGWVSGDTLVLTATEYDQDETFKLVRVEGTRLTLDHPIRHQRMLPTVESVPGLPNPALHLANFTSGGSKTAGPLHGDASRWQQNFLGRSLRHGTNDDQAGH